MFFDVEWWKSFNKFQFDKLEYPLYLYVPVSFEYVKLIWIWYSVPSIIFPVFSLYSPICNTAPPVGNPSLFVSSTFGKFFGFNFTFICPGE